MSRDDTIQLHDLARYKPGQDFLQDALIAFLQAKPDNTATIGEIKEFFHNKRVVQAIQRCLQLR